jgi:ribonuclease G
MNKDGTWHVLSSNQSVLVQVVKEPISTKDQELAWAFSCRKIYSFGSVFWPCFYFTKIEDKREKNVWNDCTIHQTKRIWCYCSHSSRRQNTVSEKICRTCSADGLQCVKLPTAHHPSKVLETQQSFFYIRDVFNDTFSGIQMMMKSCTTKQRITCKKLHHPNNQLLSFINQKTHLFFEKYNIERQIKTSFGKQYPWVKGRILL